MMAELELARPVVLACGRFPARSLGGADRGRARALSAPCCRQFQWISLCPPFPFSRRRRSRALRPSLNGEPNSICIDSRTRRLVAAASSGGVTSSLHFSSRSSTSTRAWNMSSSRMMAAQAQPSFSWHGEARSGAPPSRL
jgi:hypothetical protein